MSTISNFTEIRPVVAKLVHAERGTDRPADGHDKVIDSLREHAKALNMHFFFSWYRASLKYRVSK